MATLELCGTGKHPNINVKTQIPLELYCIQTLKQCSAVCSVDFVV